MFSMIRYPIIRDIVKECAEKFDFLEAEMGDNIRNMTMDHIIEQYYKIIESWRSRKTYRARDLAD